MIGALVFLPGEDVAIAGERAGGEKFVCAAFFESGTDEEGFGLGGKDESPEAFAAVEVEICEVDRGTGGVGEDDGVDFVQGHQLAGALDAGHSFGVGEWAGLAGEIGEGFDCGGGVWFTRTGVD